MDSDRVDVADCRFHLRFESFSVPVHSLALDGCWRAHPDAMVIPQHVRCNSTRIRLRLLGVGHGHCTRERNCIQALTGTSEKISLAIADWLYAAIPDFIPHCTVLILGEAILGILDLWAYRNCICNITHSSAALVCMECGIAQHAICIFSILLQACH